MFAGLLVAVASASAQTAEESAAFEEAKKADKTGTNPMNFSFDARIYNEFRWLNTPDDGEQNLTTFEFRMPFAGDKWQFRAKVRRAGLDVGGINESGFGDTDLRFMTIAYLNMEKRIALAPGIEVILDTASDDALGSGATQLAPFIFGAYFNPLGKGSIFVPGYQHFFSIDVDDGREDVNYGLIDMFLVKTFNDNQFWTYIDPQIILDYEQEEEYMLLELQAGTMLDKYLGTKGHSAYIMPSFGLGTDRPYDFSFELGYKVVW
jgi:hypothetical protein